MGIEIERKFLVKKPIFEAASEYIEPIEMIQGYIITSKLATVRIRIAGVNAYITMKSQIVGISRSEFEYEIPVEDAKKMIKELCSGIVEKKRYKIPYKKHIWEVDVFSGENQGLITAEVELESEDETVEIPGFIGAEVTGKKHYYNGSLARTPFNKWPEASRRCLE